MESFLQNNLLSHRKPQTSTKPFRKYIILASPFLFIFFILFLSVSFFLFLFVDFKGKPNNINNIELPDGKSLFDLNRFTFRNDSLYRYCRQYLVLGEEEEFESMVSTEFSDDEFEDSIVITTSPHDFHENAFSVKCEGTCNCYFEEFGSSRRISNLVYSSLYSSIVVVSVLGFAMAKFVDDHVDECYESARNILGDVDSDSSTSFLTCSMEKTSNCDSESSFNEKMEEGDYIKRFKCRGNCVDKKLPEKTLKFPDAQAAAEELLCSLQTPGIREIFLTESDILHASGNMLLAKRKYLKNYLTPFCKTLITAYYFDPPNGGSHFRKIRPCVSSKKKGWSINHNVFCKELEKGEVMDDPFIIRKKI